MQSKSHVKINESFGKGSQLKSEPCEKESRGKNMNHEEQNQLKKKEPGEKESCGKKI